MLASIKELFQGGRPDKFSTAAIVVGFLLAAAAAGLVIAYGKPVLIALAIGGILSVVLLNSPAIAVWAVLIGTLMVTGPLLFNVPAVDKLPWLFSMLGLFLLVAGVLYGGLSKQQRKGPVPPFVMIMAAFVAYGMLSALWVEGDSTIALTAMKRYFQFFGLTIAFALIAFPERSIKRWVAFFVILALIQLPYAIYQRFWLVMHLGYDMDSVVGLFEASREGHGSSGSLGFMQVIMFAGILSACREKLLSVHSGVVLAVIVVAPLFLADLYVVFVLLPIVAIIVFADLIRKRPLFFLTATAATFAVVAVVGAGAFIWQQSTVSADRALTIDQKLAALVDYNFGAQGYNNRSDVNRTTVYPYWWRRHGLNNPLRLIIGHGIGSTYASESVRSPLANQHNGVSIGLVATAQLLWELGITGALLYMAILVSAWSTVRKVAASAKPGFQTVLCRTLQAGVACTFVFTFYTNTTLGIASQEVLIATVLGLTAWAAREYGQNTPTLVRPAASAQYIHAQAQPPYTRTPHAGPASPQALPVHAVEAGRPFKEAH